MDGLLARWNIIYAIMLRDIRTRFGRSHLGYLIAIAWPLVHLTAIVIMLGILRTTAPIGDDNAVFIATGVAPYVLCLYPARMMNGALDANRALFSFPIVLAFDVIVARAIVEFLTGFLVLALFFLGASAAGLNLVPHDIARAATAILATVYLAICMGISNIVMVSLTRFWHMGFAIIMILVYITAGVFVLPQYVPPGLLYWMTWNPLFQCVAWLRSAYYEGYADGLLSENYVIYYATILLFLGLFGERFYRGKLLQNPT